MNDRELIEKAAKAAGKPIRWDGNVCVLTEPEWGHDDCSVWAPLVDDGDALRLAVRLRIEVQYHEALEQALATNFISREEFSVNVEDCARDENAATRRAIVVAAAALEQESGQ